MFLRAARRELNLLHADDRDVLVYLRGSPFGMIYNGGVLEMTAHINHIIV